MSGSRYLYSLFLNISLYNTFVTWKCQTHSSLFRTFFLRWTFKAAFHTLVIFGSIRTYRQNRSLSSLQCFHGFLFMFEGDCKFTEEQIKVMKILRRHYVTCEVDWKWIILSLLIRRKKKKGVFVYTCGVKRRHFNKRREKKTFFLLYFLYFSCFVFVFKATEDNTF